MFLELIKPRLCMKLWGSSKGANHARWRPPRRGPSDYIPVIRVPTWFIIYSRLRHDLGLFGARISAETAAFFFWGFFFAPQGRLAPVGLKREMLQLHLKLQQFNLSFRALIQSGLVLLVGWGLVQGGFR